jgi:pilus assembly protein CpaE
VAPVKGACGASTIACNLAFQLRRPEPARLLLADLDPLTGIVAFLLKLKSPYSFVDALSRSASLDEDLWRGIVTSRGGLDVLPAPENPIATLGELDEPTPLVEFARQHYDTVIIDSAGVLDRWGLALAAACDELLLVTTNELPAVQATQRALLRLERSRIERSKIRLVVNRYARGVGLSKEAIATALHLDVFHVVPSDYEAVHRSLVEAKPLPASSAVGRSLAELAARLSGNAPEQAVRGRKVWGGILASLFSKATL